MVCHALLQGIFPTQGSNPCFLCFLLTTSATWEAPANRIGQLFFRLFWQLSRFNYPLQSAKPQSSWLWWLSAASWPLDNCYPIFCTEFGDASWLKFPTNKKSENISFQVWWGLPSQIYFSQLCWKICYWEFPGVSRQVLYNKSTVIFQSP